jgi:uncharacterized Ntn-hydrolase superfamily protein
MSIRVAFLLGVVPVLPAARAAGQDGVGRGGDPYYSTFSIAAVDPETGEVGVAATSRVPCVGNVVPHVRAGVGAVVTQALTRVQYAEELFEMIVRGVDPESALRQAVAVDAQAGGRQIGVIAANGRSAQHTGPQAMAWAGHRSGRNYVTQGNLLVSGDVLRAVARSFEASEGSGRSLADRLIAAIDAGEAAGGDARRGLGESAAVRVADARPGRSNRPDGVTVDIDVCEHREPVGELRRMYESVSETLGYRTLQQFSGTDVYQLKLMLHALGYYRPGQPAPRPDISSHFYTAEAVAAVNAFREAEGMSGPAMGSPPGLVDEETVARLWAALERRGLADDLHRRIRELSAYR